MSHSLDVHKRWYRLQSCGDELSLIQLLLTAARGESLTGKTMDDLGVDFTQCRIDLAAQARADYLIIIRRR